jgi:hypothetical protein
MFRLRYETQLVLSFEIFIVMMFPSVLSLKSRALPKEIGSLTSHSIPAIAGPGIYISTDHGSDKSGDDQDQLNMTSQF